MPAKAIVEAVSRASSALMASCMSVLQAARRRVKPCCVDFTRCLTPAAVGRTVPIIAHLAPVPLTTISSSHLTAIAGTISLHAVTLHATLHAALHTVAVHVLTVVC